MRNNKFIAALQIAYKNLIDKNPLQLAGATAFFTTFALPCVLLILVQTIGIFYNSNSLSQGIFAQLATVLGNAPAKKMYGIFNQFQKAEHTWIAAIGGFIFMLFVVTTLFNVVRDSINIIWNVEIKKHAGIMFNLKLRLRSLLVIGFAGIIVLLQLLASVLQGLLKDAIGDVWSGYNSLLYKLISQFVFILIAIGWFTVLFRYLSNAHPGWRTAFAGGIFTSLLFTIGKIGMGFLLSITALNNLYGHAGSFVLVLLFVFYSSFIFYYGAAFTKAWSEKHNKELQLEENAHWYRIEQTRRVEHGSA